MNQNTVATIDGQNLSILLSKVGPTMRVKRLLGTLLGILGLSAGLVLAGAGTAQAVPFYCHSGDASGDYCAYVTAINPGSYLAMHLEPNYTGGTVPGYQMHNGFQLHLMCWTTGSGDADGHGDRYWFQVDSGVMSGYVNDWYLTTGSPSQWKPYVGHC